MEIKYLRPFNQPSCLLRVMPINKSSFTWNAMKQVIWDKIIHPSTVCKYNHGALNPAAAFLETCYVITLWLCPSFSFLFRETALQAYRDYSWSSAAGQSHAGGPNPKKAWPGWGRADTGWGKLEGWGGLGCIKRCGQHGDGEKGFAPLSAHLQFFLLHWPR